MTTAATKRTELRHIRDIRPGDTVLHDGIKKTVSASNLKRDAFMGVTLFGDSYHLGHKPVIVVCFMPAPSC